MSTNNNRLTTYSIYLITNNLNRKNYVGKHECRPNEDPNSRIYMGSGSELKKDQEKLGMGSFSKEVLAICYSNEIVNILEKSYIALYRSIGKAEYNIADGGAGGNLGEEVNRRISQIKKNQYLSSEGEIIKQKIREKRKLQAPMSEESKQKPTELLEYLIKTYTNENETILDFTMGSGSTGVACVNTNRNFIGIEKDDKYFKIAEDRIEFAEKNPIMDGDSPVKSEEPEDTWNMLF